MFSSINIRVFWENRLFQHNRPKAGAVVRQSCMRVDSFCPFVQVIKVMLAIGGACYLIATLLQKSFLPLGDRHGRSSRNAFGCVPELAKASLQFQ